MMTGCNPPPGSVDEQVAGILDDHMLVGPRPGQCSCGFGGADMPVKYLGRRHSVHVVEQLRAAGVLRETVEPEKTDYQLWLTALVDQAVDGVTHVLPEHLESVRDNGTQLFTRVEGDGTVRLEAATL